MPSLNFQPWKASLVEAGKSKQTIRKVRKWPLKVGDPLYLYEGMRSKDCRWLGEAVCVEVVPLLRIRRGRWQYGHKGGRPGSIKRDEMKHLALNDGFVGGLVAFEEFFARYGSMAKLVIIKWRLKCPTASAATGA